ncbi:MAG: hypothetical protein ABH950_08920 [Candidatus Altiarchaeota archaeon]
MSESKWHAVNCLRTSFDLTKTLLRIGDLMWWLKLSMIFFLAYSLIGGGSNFNSNVGNQSEDGVGDWGASNLGLGNLLLFIILIVGIGVLIFLVFVLVSSIYKFAVLDAIAFQEVDVREAFKLHQKNGVKLFFFELFLVFVVIALVVMAVSPFFLVAGILGATNSADSVSTILAFFSIIVFFIFFLVLVSILMWIIRLLLEDFVIPLMYSAKQGLWSSWRKAFHLVRCNLSQFVAYLMVKFILGIVLGIISLIISVILLFLLFLVFVFVFGLVLIPGTVIYAIGGGMSSMPGLGEGSPIPLASMIILALVFLFVFSMFWRFVGVVFTLPIYLYKRVYSLSFIALLEPEIKDLFPILTQPNIGEKSASQKRKKKTSVKKPPVKKSRKGSRIKKEKPPRKKEIIVEDGKILEF